MNTFDTESVKDIFEEGSHASSHSEKFQAPKGVVYKSDQSLVGVALVGRRSTNLGLMENISEDYQ